MGHPMLSLRKKKVLPALLLLWMVQGSCPLDPTSDRWTGVTPGVGEMFGGVTLTSMKS